MNDVGKNKTMRSFKEKEEIVKRYLSGESAIKLASEINTTDKMIREWTRKFEEKGINGLKSQTGRKKSSNKGLGLRKPKTKIDELELELMKKEIEIARLKKGYMVKGVGAEKEFVTTVNGNIRMYKKCNIKMHNFVHSFVILFYIIWRYNMEKFYQLKQELLVMKTNNIKPNYSELARIHKCDRRTVKKYDNGYEGKPINRNKESKLDKYKEEIKDKLFLPGSTIKGTYQYFKDKDESIGNYSNFYKYTIRKKIKPKKANKFHPRYETEPGKQLQFDWKEDIKMYNKHGEIFEFNIFSSTLSYSRLHVFIYSKFKTRLDVQKSLIKTFNYIGGLPKETLTDNMSSIVNTTKKEFLKEFKIFSKDIGFEPKKCKVKHPFTKGKDESCNRFMSWLIPYNGEFETEEDLIKIIEKINLKVNNQINETIGVPPIMLFQKEKEHLEPLPSNKILNSYLFDTVSVKVSNESLFYYKGSKYSVPIKFIDYTLNLIEENNKLYVYYNKDLVTIHTISDNYLNYKEEHYLEGMKTILKNKSQDEIEEISKRNLNLLNKLSEV